jgi:hypothetical protein
MSQNTHKLARISKVVSLAALVGMTVPALAADNAGAQPDPLWIWVGILIGGIAMTTAFLKWDWKK